MFFCFFKIKKENSRNCMTSAWNFGGFYVFTWSFQLYLMIWHSHNTHLDNLSRQSHWKLLFLWGGGKDSCGQPKLAWIKAWLRWFCMYVYVSVSLTRITWALGARTTEKIAWPLCVFWNWMTPITAFWVAQLKWILWWTKHGLGWRRK